MPDLDAASESKAIRTIGRQSGTRTPEGNGASRRARRRPSAPPLLLRRRGSYDPSASASDQRRPGGEVSATDAGGDKVTGRSWMREREISMGQTSVWSSRGQRVLAAVPGNPRTRTSSENGRWWRRARACCPRCRRLKCVRLESASPAGQERVAVDPERAEQRRGKNGGRWGRRGPRGVARTSPA
jgi:hypothetical protein